MKGLLLVCFCLINTTFLIGQKTQAKPLSWEIGYSVGLMHGATDVGDKKGFILFPGSYDWSTSRLNTGIYGGFIFKNVVGARLELTKGSIRGIDANSNNKYVRLRNLNYQSHIIEASLVGSFYPMSLTKVSGKWKPYVMAGIGYFSFYPMAECNGVLMALRPLHTEGQNSKEYPDRKEYSLTSVSLPLGLGVEYQVGKKVKLRIESLYRFTSTDYLDDVSTTYVDPKVVARNVDKNVCDAAVELAQKYKDVSPRANLVGKNRGNGSGNDKFFTINLKVGYTLQYHDLF